MERELRLPGELVFGYTNTCDGEDIVTYRESIDVLIARLSSSAKSGKEMYDCKIASMCIEQEM